MQREELTTEVEEIAVRNNFCQTSATAVGAVALGGWQPYSPAFQTYVLIDGGRAIGIRRSDAVGRHLSLFSAPSPRPSPRGERETDLLVR